MEYPKFKVLVRCFTFNQSKYIIDALNGFTMQQTNFPYICCIVDDASTDGEQDVIMKYIEDNFDLLNESVAYNQETDYAYISYCQHKTNKRCYFYVLLLKENHYSQKKNKSLYIQIWRDKCKYEALCEGDDYWIDSLKLQKQVDVMDKYTCCSLCFHAHNELYNDSQIIKVQRYNETIYKCSVEDIIKNPGGIMATNSMLYRLDKVIDYPNWALKSPVGDAPLALILAIRGQVCYINEVMSCYRKGAIGSWSNSMARSRKKRIKHQIKAQKMWKEFDRWSNFKYHYLVMNNRIREFISFSFKMLFSHF